VTKTKTNGRIIVFIQESVKQVLFSAVDIIDLLVKVFNIKNGVFNSKKAHAFTHLAQ
jgi:hypothetical protein